jgi:hypothetical protein
MNSYCVYIGSYGCGGEICGLLTACSDMIWKVNETNQENDSDRKTNKYKQNKDKNKNMNRTMCCEAWT